ncbi:hypothetical protein V7x_54970 [Crateriforma conspicua]|uniref:Uncharacterized protein n=3 Tax=Crateriforma TaxID=2714592 RepID=A0A5C6FFQ1_9PLAN|nr:hypothetical protein V7x_54970 [Crateriforma conspicua]
MPKPNASKGRDNEPTQLVASLHFSIGHVEQCSPERENHPVDVRMGRFLDDRLDGKGGAFFRPHEKFNNYARESGVRRVRWSVFSAPGQDVDDLFDAATDNGKRLISLWRNVYGLFVGRGGPPEDDAGVVEGYAWEHFALRDGSLGVAIEIIREENVDFDRPPCFSRGTMRIRAAWEAASPQEREAFIASLKANDWNALAPTVRSDALALLAKDISSDVLAASFTTATQRDFEMKLKESNPKRASKNLLGKRDGHSSDQAFINRVNDQFRKYAGTRPPTEVKLEIVDLVREAEARGFTLLFEDQPVTITASKRGDAETYRINIRLRGSGKGVYLASTFPPIDSCRLTGSMGPVTVPGARVG